MKKLLLGSIALLAIGIIAVAAVALLGPDGAEAQESEQAETGVEHRFGPLDDVLDELVAEDVLDSGQADAVRRRLGDKMAEGFHFGGVLPRGPKGFGFMGDGFHMDRFGGELPEGVTAPPGPPGTPEFETWLDEMTELMGDEFFGGHMFRFDGDLPDDGFFRHGPGRMGPGMMGDGFGGLRGFGDFDIDDLQGFVDDMVERFGGEIPEHMQDMLDHLQDELSEVGGAETSLDA
jgi:hypothetical protein